MQRVAAGDMEAFQALIEAHQARVVGTVAKMLGDDVDSEDIAQQVFIRVWKSAGALPTDRQIHDLAFQDHAETSFSTSCGAASATR